jgi:hypothetical protein
MEKANDTTNVCLSEIRELCKSKPGYNVIIETWSLYGNYNVRVEYFTEKKFGAMGKELDKCLAQCREYLRSL